MPELFGLDFLEELNLRFTVMFRFFFIIIANLLLKYDYLETENQQVAILKYINDIDERDGLEGSDKTILYLIINLIQKQHLKFFFLIFNPTP
ncbi:hypothetical protein BpHYR1_037943 [Brachionus plicatilis]|uniref:Uncharacterized protein n=1 Tax=Brachionus plicatilis TaxID=10195 RepID=A0A3M7QDS6_BRAPC|nr:hypothetical protein BpHYR1_037943 [Brachionus plicatilis]